MYFDTLSLREILFGVQSAFLSCNPSALNILPEWFTWPEEQAASKWPCVIPGLTFPSYSCYERCVISLEKLEPCRWNLHVTNSTKHQVHRCAFLELLRHREYSRRISSPLITLSCQLDYYIFVSFPSLSHRSYSEMQARSPRLGAASARSMEAGGGGVLFVKFLLGDKPAVHS